MNNTPYLPPNNMNQPTDPGITYDTNGNLKTWNGWVYDYDAQNRLRLALNATTATAAQFYYDGLNRQVARSIGTITTLPSPTPIPTATPPPLPTATPSPLPTIPPIGGTPTPTPTATPTATPTPTPTPGPQCSPVTFGNGNNFTVTMSTATSGATIFYTIDNSTPTHSGSTPTGTTQVYTGPVTVGKCNDMDFKALAYKSAMTDSNVTYYYADYTGFPICNGGGGQAPTYFPGLPSDATVTWTTVVFSVWDGDWAILEEYTTGNVLSQSFVQGAHGLVKTLPNNIYYYQELLGSTSHVANSAGALVEYYKYDLYGKPVILSALNTQLSTSAYGVADLHGGQRWIPELGLYDDRNRFMSPDLGRFLQPDPIGFKGDSSNLYRYCGNDWANRTDPMGLVMSTPMADQVEQNGSCLYSCHGRPNRNWTGPIASYGGNQAAEIRGQS